METESVKTRLQIGLSEFTLLTRQLLEATFKDGKVTGDQGVLTLSNVMDKLIERNTEIQSLADTAVEMCARQEEIDRVNIEMEAKERDLVHLQSKLQEAEKILEEALYKGRQKLDSISAAKNGAVSPELLIRYAHRISQASSTVSPVGWQPNDPRRPFPQDIEMRSGHLGKLMTDQNGSSINPKVNGASEANGGLQITGFNHNNNNPAGGRVLQATNSASYEEPEVMTEDTSDSSSDEG